MSFANETSHDAGGLSREFFTMLVKEIFDENLGLFSTANTLDFSYKINHLSFGRDEHFKLI